MLLTIWIPLLISVMAGITTSLLLRRYEHARDKADFYFHLVGSASLLVFLMATVNMADELGELNDHLVILTKSDQINAEVGRTHLRHCTNSRQIPTDKGYARPIVEPDCDKIARWADMRAGKTAFEFIELLEEPEIGTPLGLSIRRHNMNIDTFNINLAQYPQFSTDHNKKSIESLESILLWRIILTYIFCLSFGAIAGLKFAKSHPRAGNEVTD